MTQWHSTKARRVYRALLRIGWMPLTQTGSHIKLRHRESKYPDYIWAFRDKDEIGPRMLVRIAKHTGLQPSDL
jgi:predicted RNA binding protein YcfA (HicA-like mRNA interferase family)